jgi:hypothetical protein
MCGPAFGIMTPGTSEGTAFKKNRCTDTGTIMDGVFFDIENDTGILFRMLMTATDHNVCFLTRNTHTNHTPYYTPDYGKRSC